MIYVTCCPCCGTKVCCRNRRAHHAPCKNEEQQQEQERDDRFLMLKIPHIAVPISCCYFLTASTEARTWLHIISLTLSTNAVGILVTSWLQEGLRLFLRGAMKKTKHQRNLFNCSPMYLQLLLVIMVVSSSRIPLNLHAFVLQRKTTSSFTAAREAVATGATITRITSSCSTRVNTSPLFSSAARHRRYQHPCNYDRAVAREATYCYDDSSLGSSLSLSLDRKRSSSQDIDNLLQEEEDTYTTDSTLSSTPIPTTTFTLTSSEDSLSSTLSLLSNTAAATSSTLQSRTSNDPWSSTAGTTYSNTTDTSASSLRSSSDSTTSSMQLPLVDNDINTAYPFWDEQQLTTMGFNMDLYNLAMEDPQKAQDALEIMIDLYQRKPSNPWTVQPDASCYATVLDAWIQAGQLENAEALLLQAERQMIKNNSTTWSMGNSTLNQFIYVVMLQGWADSVKVDIAGRLMEKAHGLLDRMGSAGFEPDVKVWTIVLEGWCKRAGIVRDAMKRAADILKHLENSSNVQIRPNVLTYTSFLGGLARSKERDLATQAEAVLDRMISFGVEPDMVAYTAVINCWAKAVSRREREVAATRSLRLIGEMERLYGKDMYHVKPSLITYSTVINAIGNSLDPNAAQWVEDVLNRMYRLYDTGLIANMKPTTATYNAVIHALSRAPTSNRVRCAKRAEAILDEMLSRVQQGEKDVVPDVRTWAAVLRAWAQSGHSEAAENAQRVLDRMDTMFENRESSVRPNYVCFTTVMGAWGNARRKGSLEKMESILTRMEEGYERTLEPDIRPNTVSYVTAIDAYARRNDKDSAPRAQATLDRMVSLYAKGLGHVRPTRIVFNTLIHAWSKSKVIGAANKAERILKWMESQYRAGDDLVRPDDVTICAVLNAWANEAESGGAERALQIWEHSKLLSIQERGFPLSIMMPNIVIKALARSKDPQAAIKAEQILLQLEDDYRSGKTDLRPDVTTYSSVINACAYYTGVQPGKAEALVVSLRTFNKLVTMTDESPNNITFGTIFKAIANLMPLNNEREDLVRKLFDLCTQEGFVDSFVLSQLRAASPALYRDLVEEPCGLGGPGHDNPDNSIESVLRNIPTEWSANVVE